MKLWISEAKPYFEKAIAIFNVGLPSWMLLATFESNVDNFKKWFPYKPVEMSLMYIFGYLIFLILFWCLYKNKKKIGHLKTMGIVLATLLLVLGYSFAWLVFLGGP